MGRYTQGNGECCGSAGGCEPKMATADCGYLRYECRVTAMRIYSRGIAAAGAQVSPAGQANCGFLGEALSIAPPDIVAGAVALWFADIRAGEKNVFINTQDVDTQHFYPDSAFNMLNFPPLAGRVPLTFVNVTNDDALLVQNFSALVYGRAVRVIDTE